MTPPPLYDTHHQDSDALEAVAAAVGVLAPTKRITPTGHVIYPRNSSGLTCDHCHRVFAAGHVPAPHTGGPYDGGLLCRDCTHTLENPKLF